MPDFAVEEGGASQRRRDVRHEAAVEGRVRWFRGGAWSGRPHQSTCQRQHQQTTSCQPESPSVTLVTTDTKLHEVQRTMR